MITTSNSSPHRTVCHSRIQDALNNLRVLEREEERMAAEDKKRILQQTVQKLKSIAPRFGESDRHNLVVWKHV
jgi:hypothetical protein